MSSRHLLARSGVADRHAEPPVTTAAAERRRRVDASYARGEDRHRPHFVAGLTSEHPPCIFSPPKHHCLRGRTPVFRRFGHARVARRIEHRYKRGTSWQQITEQPHPPSPVSSSVASVMR